MQEKRIDGAEDGGVGSDTQREREDGNYRKAGML
jgi:hypothetical protein